MLLQSGPCATCESYLTRYPNAGWVCKEYATVDGDRWCRFYQDRVTRDLRPGVMGAEGDSGWALYVKDLIPTSGGTLPGWARLQGNLPAGAEHGDTVTLTGQWIGTPPNNLCANCGWDFLVESEAAAGTPTTPGGGAITQDSPEIVKARIEASGVQAERDAIAAGATAEEAAQVRAETEAELANGADGTDGLPPVTRAGIGSGALAALIVGGIVLLPILGKGRKRNGGAPGGIASW